MFQIQIFQCQIGLQLVLCVFTIDNIIDLDSDNSDFLGKDNEPLGHGRGDLVRKQELDHAGGERGHQRADQWRRVAAPQH